MKILSVKQYGVSLKATVQATGKLGFGAGTAHVLELPTHTYMRFAMEDEASGVLYLAVMPGADEDGFKILQSGGYYYINTKPLFEALELDFRSQLVIYDLQRDKSKDAELGGTAYRMEPRIKPRQGDSGDEMNGD